VFCLPLLIHSFISFHLEGGEGKEGGLIVEVKEIFGFILDPLKMHFCHRLSLFVVVVVI